MDGAPTSGNPVDIELDDLAAWKSLRQRIARGLVRVAITKLLRDDCAVANDQEPAVKERSKGAANAWKGKLRPALTFENVQFGYQPGNPILKGISFDLAPGEHVALVGTSGAGKSTIVNLLLRFWDATGGDIRIGGRPSCSSQGLTGATRTVRLAERRLE